MRKFLLAIVSLLFAVCGYSQAVQANQANVNSQNEVHITINNFKLLCPADIDGNIATLTEFTDMGDYAMDAITQGKARFKVRAAVTEDIDTRQKVGYIVIFSANTYLGIASGITTTTISFDELDKCISTIKYMKENMFMKPNAGMMECCYETKSGDIIMMSNSMHKFWYFSLAGTLAKVTINDLNHWINTFESAKQFLSEKLM